MLYELSYEAKLVEHWTSIPKVAGSIPTLETGEANFSGCPGGCTLRVTSQTSYSPEHISPTHTKSKITKCLIILQT